MDDIRDSLPAGLRKIDNFEGITWGPKSPKGNQTLLLVTDNNFNSNQVTQFVTLEYIP